MANSSGGLENIPSGDLMAEVLRRMKCSTKPDKRFILTGMESGDDSQAKSNLNGFKSQLRWNGTMDKMLIDMLYEEAKQGKKHGNLWDNSVWIPIMDALTKKCQQEVNKRHIESRLRTMKSEYKNFLELKAKSGFGWDPDRKTVTAPDNIWDTLLQTPGADKKFKHFRDRGLRWNFDKISVVIGNDHVMGAATYEGSKHVYVDINDGVDLTTDLPNMQETQNLDDVKEDASMSVDSGRKRATSSNQKKQHGKKPRISDELRGMLEGITHCLNGLAKSVDALSIPKMLYDEIMKCKGFSTEYLDAAFDIITENDCETNKFLVKNEQYRVRKLKSLRDQIGDI